MQDELLLRLLEERSEEALPLLQQTYGPYCRAIARNILQNEQDSEECVDDAYMAVWNAIPPARPQHLKAYLGAVVRNRALRQRQQSPTPALELSEELCAEGGVYEHCEAKALGEAVSAFLRTQSAGTRTAFVRRYWYADSVEAVALGQGWSVSKTKSVLFRTRKKLRTYLEKEGFLP